MIYRIRIQNFKSLRDVTVELSSVTVFIGKSGTGKTNFALAIRFLRDYLVHGTQGQVAQVVQQYAPIKCATNPSGAVEFQVEFDVPGFEERFVYTLRLDEQGPDRLPQLESLEHGGRTVFRQALQPQGRRRDQPQWEVEPTLVSPPKPGVMALGRLPGLEDVVVAYTALTAGIGVYALPYDVLKAPAEADGASGLADDGRNFLRVMKDIAINLQDVTIRRGITAALRQVNSTVAAVELDAIQQPKTAYVGHRLGERTLTLELRQESDGFRRFYAHLLALYQTPPKQTLVFEEPENGIYPGALALLADEFKAAPEAQPARGQVLVTTHSPALLDHFSADQIRVVELVDLETKIGRLAEEQKQSLVEELLRAGELLTVDPARRQAG